MECSSIRSVGDLINALKSFSIDMPILLNDQSQVCCSTIMEYGDTKWLSLRDLTFCDLSHYGKENHSKGK